MAALFRAVHTLKGAAYVVGCTPMGAVAHGVEDLLVAVRAGRLEVTPAALDEVHAAVDLAKRMLDPAAEPALDFTRAADHVRGRLARLLAEAPAPVGGRPTVAPFEPLALPEPEPLEAPAVVDRASPCAVATSASPSAPPPAPSPRGAADDPRRARSARRAHGSRGRAGHRPQRARAPARGDRPTRRGSVRQPGATGSGGRRHRAPEPGGATVVAARARRSRGRARAAPLGGRAVRRARVRPLRRPHAVRAERGRDRLRHRRGPHRAGLARPLRPRGRRAGAPAHR